MARSPNENVIKAQEMYKQGIKLIDIANTLGVPDGTVRRWKSTYKWDSEESERSDKKVNKKSERSEKKRKQKIEKKEVVVKEVGPVVENAELTEKQRLFCLFYVKYRNKVKAYQKAYECSYDCACSHASTLWKNGEVQKEVNRLLEGFRESVELDIRDLFQWYLDIARADINDFVKFNGPMISVRNNIDGLLVSEVSETGNGIKVKLNDRMKAMQWLGEHIGLATEEQRARIAALKAKTEEPENKPIQINFVRASETNGRN